MGADFAFEEENLELGGGPVRGRAEAVVGSAVGEYGAGSEDAVLDPGVGEGELGLVLVMSWEGGRVVLVHDAYVDSSRRHATKRLKKTSAVHAQFTIAACSPIPRDQYELGALSSLPSSPYLPAKYVRIADESLSVRAPSTRQGTSPRGLMARYLAECCSSVARSMSTCCRGRCRMEARRRTL